MRTRRTRRSGAKRRWIAVLLDDGHVVRGGDGRFLMVEAFTAKAARHALKPFVTGAFQVQQAS